MFHRLGRSPLDIVSAITMTQLQREKLQNNLRGQNLVESMVKSKLAERREARSRAREDRPWRVKPRR